MLEKTAGEVAREINGFSFPMRVGGSVQTVRVFVSDDALVGRAAFSDEGELRARVGDDRLELESIASKKFRQGRVTADGVVLVTLSDVLSFF